MITDSSVWSSSPLTCFHRRLSFMDIALFSPSSLFESDDDDDKQQGKGEVNESSSDIYVQRNHTFPGEKDICVREFSFHCLNANLLWPGTFAFSEWLLQNNSFLQGNHHRILELGSGTGALAIFLRKTFGVDITTSDFDDGEIEGNIAHNCRVNEIEVLPHIRHTWGETFPREHPDWDVIIASDILLYVKQYPNLIKTLSFLLMKGSRACEMRIAGKEVHCPVFVMSWRRRIGKEEALFFGECQNAGFVVEHVGSRVYVISCPTPKSVVENTELRDFILKAR